MDIRVLPSNVANMIAAGEVVQRPSSVVKELMENAVDAGATKIQLIVQDAGRTLVQVIDNACGMTADDAVLCFERHATSKIRTAEDLHKISSFGFRGEALSSISAVAEVTLRTRTADQEVGTQVVITDATATEPGRQDVSECATPVGSNFAIRNLFYNTPARRKFLKADSTELKAIISEFIRVALTRIDIAFSLVSNDREIYRLSAVKTLKLRIRDLFPGNLADSLLPVDITTSSVSIGGYISRPEACKKTGYNQFLFVNGRFFKSPALHKAVLNGYQNLIPEGSNPSYFIYLEVDPSKVDFNVHPTKTEIKFEDENVMFTVVQAAVRQSLGRGSGKLDTIDFDNSALPQMHNVGTTFDEYKSAGGELGFEQDSSFNPFENDGFGNREEWEQARPYQPVSPAPYASTPYARAQNPSMDFAVLYDQHPPVRERSSMLIKDKYIISVVPSGVMVINAVRAMERVMYERFVDAMSKEMPVGQTSLFPMEIEVGVENMPILEEYLPMMQKMGFDYVPFSSSSINVTAVPSGLADDRMSLQGLMYEAITALAEEKLPLASALYSGLAGKMAKSASRSAVLPSDELSAKNLADSLYACENPEFTPDGRKIVHILQIEEIDKLFR